MRVSLIGLDFGTTTSSAVIATARVERRWSTGRVELDAIEERYRSPFVFTPLRGERLDVDAIAALVDGWLAAAGVRADELFGGGAIITGLAARRQNAEDLARVIRARAGGAVMATAGDPCLESFLAFMGSAAALSAARPDTPVLNLDIGGGTTNLALGQGGLVIRTGCLFIGARHIEVTPGTTRIVRLSDHGEEILRHLGVPHREGQALDPAEIAAVLDFQVSLLEAEVTGREEAFAQPLGARLRAVPLRLPAGSPRPAITFSGGVGELIYQRLRGAPPPALTCFGDLGGELAARILASPVLGRDVLVPASTGRAVSYGLLRHSTRISGATIFLPRPEALPLADLPLVRRLSSTAPAEEIAIAVDLARRGERGGAVQVDDEGRGPAALKDLGERFARALDQGPFGDDRPLVILISTNVGKALGGYITGWGTRPRPVVVIDEIAPADAQLVQIGRLTGDIVPVSFYGFSPLVEAR